MARPRLLLLLAAAAVAAELAGWLLGSGNKDATFAWFRVAAHAGTAGFALAIAAGLAAALAADRLRAAGITLPRPLLVLGAAATALHLLFLDTPQGQPDTANYFVYAQHIAADPLHTLVQWKALVWDVDQGRFHTYLPLVPLLYGLAFAVLGEHPAVADLLLTAFAVALPLAVARLGRTAGHPRAGLAAGWLVLTLPYLQAHSGWLLVDLPLTLFVCLAWTALLRARTPTGWLLAAALCALPLATKGSALLFVAGPLFVLATRAWRRRWLLVRVTGGAIAALVVLHRPFMRAAETYPETALSLLLQLRPGLWGLAGVAVVRRDRLATVLAAALCAVPVLILYGSPEHVARYALPLAPALALAAARAASRPLLAGLATSGLVLLLAGYRPVLVHHQAANLQAATRQLQASGVDAIEVWCDVPGTTFPTGATAALVDYYATVPVGVGGTLRIGEPGPKQHWWDHFESPPWHDRPPADGVLLGLYGATAREFEQGPGADLDRIEEVSLYRGSSWLLPRSVVLYRRTPGEESP